MAIINSVELHHIRLDPAHPNSTFNKVNPTWEIQIRTDSLQQKEDWVALKLKPKLLVGKEGAPNEGEAILNERGNRQWRVNLRKKSMKDGVKAPPVIVQNGAMEPVDPNTLGNGSIANIRVFQYDYLDADKNSKTANILMAVQVVKHILYIPAPREEFGSVTTEVVQPAPKAEGSPTAPGTASSPTAAPSPAPAAPSPAPFDKKPEDAF
jgi:hypothetical protein